MWSQGKKLNPSNKPYTFGDLRSDLEQWRLSKSPDFTTKAGDSLPGVLNKVLKNETGEREAQLVYFESILGREDWTEEEVVRYLRRSQRPYKHYRTTCSLAHKEQSPAWYAYHTGSIPNFFHRLEGFSAHHVITNAEKHDAALEAVREAFLDFAVVMANNVDPSIAVHFDFTGLQEWLDAHIHRKGRVEGSFFTKDSYWRRICEGMDLLPEMRNLARVPLDRLWGITLQNRVRRVLSPYDRSVAIEEEMRHLVRAFRDHKKPATVAKKASAILRFYLPIDSYLLKALTCRLKRSK